MGRKRWGRERVRVKEGENGKMERKERGRKREDGEREEKGRRESFPNS